MIRKGLREPRVHRGGEEQIYVALVARRMATRQALWKAATSSRSAMLWACF